MSRFLRVIFVHAYNTPSERTFLMHQNAVHHHSYPLPRRPRRPRRRFTGLSKRPQPGYNGIFLRRQHEFKQDMCHAIGQSGRGVPSAVDNCMFVDTAQTVGADGCDGQCAVDVY